MKYDWAKIEQEYVSGKMTMEGLAKKYGIPNSSFRKYANGHKFKEKRTEYGQKVAERALARAQARDARTLGNLSSALDKAARLLNKYVADEKTLHTKIVNHMDGSLEEVKVEKLDTKALRDMTAAMREVSAAIKLLQPEKESDTGDREGVIVLTEREVDEE